MTTATLPTAGLLPYRCQSFHCIENAVNGDVGRVLFLEEGQACPKCYSKKYLHQLAIIHLLQRCGEDDPAALQGKNGMWKIVCGTTPKQAKRMATERDILDGDGFDAGPIVTCPKCRELTQDQQPPKRPGIEI